ncbi:hypothetical protein HPB51_022832 [Rhipicephalus microplus]|uniref:Uncharacterized protein n=1 Tax=Rhipicephalus microplus TaxID=6941 RepID=A0A9J6DQN6_RHIMP|nr:hypothetical protein HPB51_022832 [Rhipicephalus microplus]
MRCVVLLQLAVAVLLLLLPGQPEAAAGGRRVVRYRCQYLRTHNRTKIVCSPVEVSQAQPATTTSLSMQPEAFNGQRTHKGHVCHKLRELVERLAITGGRRLEVLRPQQLSARGELVVRLHVFQESAGGGRVLTRLSSLMQSPHCTSNVLSGECSQCLGRCWIMYVFPGARANSPGKDFPCDPLGCGGAQLRKTSKTNVTIVRISALLQFACLVRRSHMFTRKGGGYKFKDD